MEYTQFELIYRRVKAFAVQAGALLLGAILTAIVNTLASTEFTNMIVENFGEFWGAGLGLIVLNALVSHITNLKAVRDYKKRLGGDTKEPPVLI